MLMQSIMFELKRLDNSNNYNIEQDVKKIYDELKSLNSKQLTLNDFLINPKLNIAELLNNSYSYFLIKSGGFDILLIQQKVINSFASSLAALLISSSILLKFFCTSPQTLFI